MRADPARPFRVPLPALARVRGWRDDRGIAAVEFALIVPLMMTLFFGMSDISVAINMNRKLTILSRSLGDLVSRLSSISTTEMGNVFAAGSAIMRPYAADNVQMVLSAVTVTANGSTYTGKVAWSCGKNIGTKAANQSQADYDAKNLKVRAPDSEYAVPQGFQSSSTKSFLLAETLVPYQSTFGQYLVGDVRFRETLPWPVRNSDKITGPGTCPT